LASLQDFQGLFVIGEGSGTGLSQDKMFDAQGDIVEGGLVVWE